MPARTVIVALLLWPGAVAAANPWPDGAAYHLRVDSQLTTDRWRGPSPEPIDRLDVRQRLELGVFGEVVSFHADVEIGSDLGPTADELTARPDARRVELDVRSAHLAVRDLGGVVDARLGRHVLYDALGFDALDGATVEVHALPHLSVEGSAGFAARRGWSDFGPDIYSPDGTVLPDDPGYLVGAALATRELRYARARAAWRRLFDGDDVQRDEAGLGLSVGPLGPVELEGGGRVDTVFARLTETWGGARLRVGPTRWRAAWRRVEPVFAADSIWNAFGAEPYHAADAGAAVELGPWRVDADGGGRRFDDEASAGDAGLRLVRRFAHRARAGHVGVEGRGGFGHGGARHYGDAFGSVPLPTTDPTWLRVRAGAVHVGDPDRTSGWGLLALTWQAAENLRVEALGEAFGGADLPYRIRGMGRLTVEEWL